MTAKDFLFELGCEELPAKNLYVFANKISQAILDTIKNAGLAFAEYQLFVTPRRIALLISKLSSASPDKTLSKKGPAKKPKTDLRNPAAFLWINYPLKIIIWFITMKKKAKQLKNYYPF